MHERHALGMKKQSSPQLSSHPLTYIYSDSVVVVTAPAAAAVVEEEELICRRRVSRSAARVESSEFVALDVAPSPTPLPPSPYLEEGLPAFAREYPMMVGL